MPPRLAIAISVLLMVAVPARAGCEDVSGPSLKSCLRMQAARARADARSTPYLPSSVHPVLAIWDGDNPFASEEYRVRVTESGIAPVDAYLQRAFRIQAIVVGARFVVDRALRGDPDAISALPALVPMLEEVPQDAEALFVEGDDIAVRLPNLLAGPDILKLPRTLAAIKDASLALTSSVREVGDVLADLRSAVARPQSDL